MKHHGIVAAIVIFVLIIAGMFIFAFLKTSEISNVPVQPVTDETEEELPYGAITRIDGKHYFNGTEHTVVGEILMPTACDLLNWDTAVAESMPEQATISFTVVNSSEVCAQVVTPQRFYVRFNASEQATIDATLNGRAVELNLVPAAPGELPEDYEFSGKG